MPDSIYLIKISEGNLYEILEHSLLLSNVRMLEPQQHYAPQATIIRNNLYEAIKVSVIN